MVPPGQSAPAGRNPLLIQRWIVEVESPSSRAACATVITSPDGGSLGAP